MVTPQLERPFGFEKEWMAEFQATAGSSLRKSLFTALASKHSQDSDVFFVLYALDARQAKQLSAGGNSADVAKAELGTEVASAFLSLSHVAKSAAKSDEDEEHKATLQLVDRANKSLGASLKVAVAGQPLLRMLRVTLDRYKSAAAAMDAEAVALPVNPWVLQFEVSRRLTQAVAHHPTGCHFRSGNPS